jgi:4-hydroxythreonine-4-phosphate dehydrogenase
MIPHIALTTGEPGGVGPDLCLALAQESFPCKLTVIGDPDLLRARANHLGMHVELYASDLHSTPTHQPGSLWIYSAGIAPDPLPGRLSTLNAPYVLETLKRGAHACLNGWVDALVTPPVHKGIINDAGFPFTGHTEFFANLTGGSPVMLLATEGLKVALATTHLPLSKVSDAIQFDSLAQTIKCLHAELIHRFQIAQPRILVCGLNPHAGENGHLGTEELNIITPCIELMKQQGIDARGPVPADTAFTPPSLAEADVILAMYHDQGLPVLKHKGFGRAVNITLGLPIIRTSVDHGTALDLAGTGNVDPGSLFMAVDMAIEMCRNRTP